MSQETSAAVFVIVLVGLVLLWAVVRLVRTSFTLSQAFLFSICVLVTRLLWRTSIPKRLPLDDAQGAVIMSNHRSSVDPFFIQACTDRLVHWMVTRETFNMPIGGWVMRAIHAIPVRRSGVDTAATKTAIRYAAEGGLVGIFPEGRINQSDDFFMKVRPGAALIALRAGVPILPCYIEGAPYGGTELSPFRMPARVRLVYGNPIDLSEFYGQDRNTEVLQIVMRRCIAEIARLAGNSVFELQFAGRKWAAKDDQD